MVQTSTGAAANPWIRHLRGCARSYQALKAERANMPRRRVNEKASDDALYVKKPPPPPAAVPPPLVRVAAPAPRTVLSPAQALRLSKYAQAGRKLLEGLEGRRASAARFYHELASVGDIKKELGDVGLPTRSSVASFVRAFPIFKLEVPANGGAAFVSLR
jgi:hypothetical protein